MAASLRVFLDSNVVLSAFFSDRGAPSRILDVLAARLPPVHPLIGEYNLLEIERNMGKRLFKDPRLPFWLSSWNLSGPPVP